VRGLKREPQFSAPPELSGWYVAQYDAVESGVSSIPISTRFDIRAILRQPNDGLKCSNRVSCLEYGTEKTESVIVPNDRKTTILTNTVCLCSNERHLCSGSGGK
jgi:hypothetical protein